MDDEPETKGEGRTQRGVVLVVAVERAGQMSDADLFSVDRFPPHWQQDGRV